MKHCVVVPDETKTVGIFREIERAKNYAKFYYYFTELGKAPLIILA